MTVILFEGDYVQQTGSETYSRVVDILDADHVLLANGNICRADVTDVQNYMSESEFAEYVCAAPVRSYSAHREV